MRPRRQRQQCVGTLNRAVPEIFLRTSIDPNVPAWHPKRDLLNSNPTALEFVVEIDTDSAAYLRFGDNLLGKRPESGTQFTATYRVGNGVAGNVGAESLAHIVTGLTAISLVRNPLSAQGGVEPETIEDVRQRAPAAFRTQERAVTEADYAEVTQRDKRVQRAAATFRWTGSWHTVFLTVDRLGGLLVDDPFKTSIRDFVERYRMAGYDLEVDAPRICIAANRNARLRASRIISAATWKPRCCKFSATRFCPMAGAASFIRTISLSAKRFISVRSSQPRRLRMVSRRCRSPSSSARDRTM